MLDLQSYAAGRWLGPDDSAPVMHSAITGEAVARGGAELGGIHPPRGSAASPGNVTISGQTRSGPCPCRWSFRIGASGSEGRRTAAGGYWI